MRDVDALWAKFARHALRQHAQSCFGCGELGETWFAAQAAGGAGEQHRAAAERHKAPSGFPADQESAEAADAPEFLERLRRQFTKVLLAIVACVVSDEIECIQFGARSHGMIEQPDDVLFTSGVHNECFRAA